MLSFLRRHHILPPLQEDMGQHVPYEPVTMWRRIRRHPDHHIQPPLRQDMIQQVPAKQKIVREPAPPKPPSPPPSPEPPKGCSRWLARICNLFKRKRAEPRPNPRVQPRLVYRFRYSPPGPRSTMTRVRVSAAKAFGKIRPKRPSTDAEQDAEWLPELNSYQSYSALPDTPGPHSTTSGAEDKVPIRSSSGKRSLKYPYRKLSFDSSSSSEASGEKESLEFDIFEIPRPWFPGTAREPSYRTLAEHVEYEERMIRAEIHSQTDSGQNPVYCRNRSDSGSLYEDALEELFFDARETLDEDNPQPKKRVRRVMSLSSVSTLASIPEEDETPEVYRGFPRSECEEARPDDLLKLAEPKKETYEPPVIDEDLTYEEQMSVWEASRPILKPGAVPIEDNDAVRLHHSLKPVRQQGIIQITPVADYSELEKRPEPEDPEDFDYLRAYIPKAGPSEPKDEDPKKFIQKVRDDGWKDPVFETQIGVVGTTALGDKYVMPSYTIDHPTHYFYDEDDPKLREIVGEDRLRELLGKDKDAKPKKEEFQMTLEITQPKVDDSGKDGGDDEENESDSN